MGAMLFVALLFGAFGVLLLYLAKLTGGDEFGGGGLFGTFALIFLGIAVFCFGCYRVQADILESFGSVIESGKADQEFLDESQLTILSVEETMDSRVVVVKPLDSFFPVVLRLDVSRESADKYLQMLREKAWIQEDSRKRRKLCFSGF